MKENWLTRPPHSAAFSVMAMLGIFVCSTTFFYLSHSNGAAAWMPASGDTVAAGEFWRLWSSLFIHADLGHLMSNLFLFLPLTYLLAGYFGPLFAPSTALLAGGLVNWLVLFTLPGEAKLIGISGVVYWMAAAWTVFFLFVDRRERLRRRIGSVLFLSLFLLVPETLKPEVSHLSHFLGYVLGWLMATPYYFWKQRTFQLAEIYELPPVPLTDPTREEWMGGTA